MRKEKNGEDRQAKRHRRVNVNQSTCLTNARESGASRSYYHLSVFCVRFPSLVSVSPRAAYFFFFEPFELQRPSAGITLSTLPSSLLFTFGMPHVTANEDTLFLHGLAYDRIDCEIFYERHRTRRKPN